MKKVLSIMLLASSLFSGECVLISSPYQDVKKITESSFYAQEYNEFFMNEKKENKHLDFSEAYIMFVNALSENAKNHCLSKEYNGIYNVKIEQSVGIINNTRKFFFTASVDYVKE